MKDQNIRASGSGERGQKDVQQPSARQQNDSQPPIPDKLHRGRSAKERAKDVAEAEVEDFFRMDQQRIPEVERDRDEGIDTPS
ncbi:MAG TPA: hypothetical protein VJU83_03800 [Burkholderiales bacterium]|nr:hypothetical protein [Burkholderiales bacterium]